MQDCKPDLLVVSPPCSSNAGGQHLNRPRFGREEIQEKSRLVRLFANFAADLVRIQLASGGRFLVLCVRQRLLCGSFPRSSLFREPCMRCLWICVAKLAAKGKFLQKPTKLLVSHESMHQLLLDREPGCRRRDR